MNNSMGIIVETAAYFEGRIYFPGLDTNALFSFDVDDFQIRYEMSFDEPSKHNLYRNSYIYNGHMWLIPWESTRIVCVDLQNKEATYYDIKFKQVTTQKVKYSNCAYYYAYKLSDSKIVAVPRKYDMPAIIDMKENRVEFLNVDYDNSKSLFITGFYNENKLYFISDIGEQIYIYDLKTSQTESIKDEFFRGQYEGALNVDGKVWFAPKNTEYIAYYDLKGKSAKKVKYSRIGDESFWEVKDYGNSILLLPRKGKRVLIIDKSDFKMDFIDFAAENLNALRSIDSKDEVWLTALIDKKMYRLNGSIGKDMHIPQIGGGDYAGLLSLLIETLPKEEVKRCVLPSGICTEEDVSLAAFLNYLKRD